jgi:hypothetical protein
VVTETVRLMSEGAVSNEAGEDLIPAETTRPETREGSSLLILTLFWAYATATNLLWGMSMKASLATIGVTHVFSAWDARLVQHLLLYPALVGALWVSRQIGWKSLGRAIPLQLLCALVFSALGNPAMDVAESIVGVYPWHDLRIPGWWRMEEEYPGRQSLLWIASLVSFLIDYAFCLALLAGFEFYRRFRDAQVRAREAQLRTQALERSLSAAQLAALRMQLSPHTLFNLLHTIRGQVGWDPNAAQAMIVQLGELLRLALRAGEQELTLLHDELEYVRLYLELQQRRFADRLSLDFPDLKSCPPVWVPSLILQPLVENAVVHGLAQAQAQITIRVGVAVEGETLILRVLNSMASGTIVGTARQGIGLKNVRERLAIQFPGRASCNAGPSSQDVWLAELRLPMLHSES